MPFPDPDGPSRVSTAELVIIGGLVAAGWALMLRELVRMGWRLVG